MDTSPWDVAQRGKFGDIAETSCRSGKGMWVSSGRGTKRRAYFYGFWKLPS